MIKKLSYVLIALRISNLCYADSQVVVDSVLQEYKRGLEKEVVLIPQKSKDSSKSNIDYEPCFNEAAIHYNVPSNLLKAIATVESKMNPLAVGYNKNGSFDIGIMQINSHWLPKLQRIGVERGELLDGCKNIQIGAWILSDNIKRYGLTAEAIGRYNSPNPYYKSRYVKLVLAEYNRTKKAQMSLAVKGE